MGKWFCTLLLNHSHVVSVHGGDKNQRCNEVYESIDFEGLIIAANHGYYLGLMIAD